MSELKPLVIATHDDAKPKVRIATHADAKALGYCNAGLRRWFPRDGVSFVEFRRRGVSNRWLRATGDAMALRLAEAVEAGQTRNVQPQDKAGEGDNA